MDVKQVSQWMDEQVFKQSGKRLDDVQKAIIDGSFQGKSYKDIGSECNRSESHVRDMGAELWKLLSNVLNEDVKKSNSRSILERAYIKYIKSSENFNVVINGNNNRFCPGETSKPSNKSNTKKNSQSNSSYHDLTLAPKIINFHNRETELENLSNWILNQNTRLISVLGLLGIGKTTLVKRFIDLNLQQFEVIIWRSLKFPKSLNLLLYDLLIYYQEKLKDSLDGKLRQLLDLLIDKKCLIILDDVQNIFITGQLSGQYQTEYSNYQNLFKMLTEVEHQSHFILISQEQCAEMHCLDEELYPIKCLELSGIENNVHILNNKVLKDEDRWLELINLYEGNPFYLKDITILIKDVFDGKVSDFLSENSLVITKNIQSTFKELFNRLSPLEQQLILELSKIDNSLSREDLRQNIDLSSTDFMNSLQSLQQRYLVRKINETKILFNLSPVFKEYLRNFYS